MGKNEIFCEIFGAYYGYTGGGEYDGGFFFIDSNINLQSLLSFNDVDANENCNIFYSLLFECSKMYSNKEGKYILTNYSKNLIKKGDKTKDGIIFMDFDFDGDYLDNISQNWGISLKFNS